MKLTDAQNEKLEWLHKQGGSGYLDKHGLIAGGDGRLTITDYGRRHMAPSWATE